MGEPQLQRHLAAGCGFGQAHFLSLDRNINFTEEQAAQL